MLSVQPYAPKWEHAPTCGSNEEEKKMLSVCICVYVCESHHIHFSMREPIFMEFGMYIMAFKPDSTAYFINPSTQCVCVCVYFPVVARQLLSKNFSAALNIEATTE
jgi:hypothetical protein